MKDQIEEFYEKQGELISRQALVEEIYNLSVNDPRGVNYATVMYEIKCAPAADVVEVGNCAGCLWAGRKRPQKCSCCRRNPDMKDCWEAEQ